MRNPPSKGRPGDTPRRSPLGTPKDTELAKRLVIQERGKDLDGAYRAVKRLDAV
jgi:hypothetical protein